MWHEARRREKATQKLFSDHKKRAEKRRGENRIDPNSLLQVHGIKAKLCLDPSVYKQALKSLVAWQGDKSIQIDRFDVRATLSSIPSDTPSQSGSQQDDKAKTAGRSHTVLDSDESESMKKILNYERYRLLIQSDLNKVPEELRLKLVTDSDVLYDAKMRKLRNNKFGTSGEASIATSQSHYVNNQKTIQSRDSVKRGGAAIGFTYNSVPPPSCLTDNTFKGTDGTQQEPASMNSSDSAQASYMDILDLVDNDDFDLESVNMVDFDPKRCDEIARKYNLLGEELTLLAKRDSLETGSASDLKRELDRLKIKLNVNQNNHSVSKHDSQVYGPALPPNLVVSQNLGSPLSTSSGSDSSPVRQRSPSGIADIPLRNGRPGSESGESQEPLDTKSSNLGAEARNPSPRSNEQIALSSMKEKDQDDPSISRQHRLEVVINADAPMKFSERKQSDQISPRRASTPLAYKKNCRSSRSLSREKRSRRHKSSRRRRRGNRSTSSSGSSSSPLSSSSRSSSYSPRHNSRRRKRSRYRRDSYR